MKIFKELKNRIKYIGKHHKRAIVLVVTFIFLASSIAMILYLTKTISIKRSNELWEIYDKNFEHVKINMDEISVSDDNYTWSELKDFEIKDKEYMNYLNVLTRYINSWYYFYTSKETAVLNCYPLRSCKEKKEITPKELNSINWMEENSKFLAHDLAFLQTLNISKKETRKTQILEKLKELEAVHSTKLYTKDDPTYEELVFRKIMDSNTVYYLSEWLKQEYYNLK